MRFFAAILVALFVSTFFADDADARRFRFRYYGGGSSNVSETLLRVMDLPDIPALKRKDGKYIDLGYKFDVGSMSKGEWVGYIGSDTSYLPLKEGMLDMMLALSGLKKLPPIPTATRGEKNVPVKELRRRQKILSYARKFNLRVRRYDEPIDVYEGRILEAGMRKAYNLRPRNDGESVEEYREWLTVAAAKAKEKARLERKNSWSFMPSFGTMLLFSIGFFIWRIYANIRGVWRWITGADKKQATFNTGAIESRLASEIQAMQAASGAQQPQPQAQGFANMSAQPTPAAPAFSAPPARPATGSRYSTVRPTAKTTFGQRGL
ncbi:MAG TPA: hypothetical protein ENJ55_06030 [Rhizobiales bacterium]|nr:hypothetical protein [Hyphomicrobiales bacterium]